MSKLSFTHENRCSLPRRLRTNVLEIMKRYKEVDLSIHPTEMPTGTWRFQNRRSGANLSFSLLKEDFPKIKPYFTIIIMEEYGDVDIKTGKSRCCACQTESLMKINTGGKNCVEEDSYAFCNNCGFLDFCDMRG